MECGEAQKIIKMNSLMNILANGLIISLMGLVNILGATMEMFMKENGNIVSDMGRELIVSL
jgi:excinuclease UvrABC helicase subunit UvrB